LQPLKQRRLTPILLIVCDSFYPRSLWTDEPGTFYHGVLPTEFIVAVQSLPSPWSQFGDP
ncbi:MAG: hypothetical protein VW349_03450, partial [Gammaproteobacteria bacterium]